MLAGLSVAFCLAVLISALPWDMGKVQELEGRQLAKVITHCTVPNTVALTFVSHRLPLLHAETESLGTQDDGPYNYMFV